MNAERIEEILDAIKAVNVAVYGDFCLDAYWVLDPRGSEVSVETGLRAQGVASHSYSLGGAANVVANLAALEPASVHAIGVVGDDVFGRELRRQLEALEVDTDRLVIQREAYDTVTFGKRYLDGVEQPRIDFGFDNSRTRETDGLLLDGIHRALQTADALIVNQQVPGSITNASFIEEANALFAQVGDTVVLLDTRHCGRGFKHISRKTNTLEAARLCGATANESRAFPRDALVTYGKALYGWFEKPVFITHGPEGIVTVDAAGVHETLGVQLSGRLDPVGAGDTVTSALALCLGAGISPAEAAEFANLAAAVTVRKLLQTGTASAAEILELSRLTAELQTAHTRTNRS